MVETKTQRNARLKAMRKKYGLGEFKRSSSSSSPKRRARVGGNVARRRKSKSRSRSSGGFSPMDAALGGAAYGAAVNFIPSQYNTRLVRAGASFLLAYKTSGFLKKVGTAGLCTEAAGVGNSLGQQVAGSVAGTLTGAAGSNAVANGWV